MNSIPIHVLWRFRVRQDGSFIVLPDGCEDLLLLEYPDSRRSLTMASRDLGPRPVQLRAGLVLTGYRLRPGVPLPTDEVPHLRPEPDEIVAFIHSLSGGDAERYEIIDALAGETASMTGTARSAGVSLRTLQRIFRRWGLPSPDYWRLLGRARRAALSLSQAPSLVELALDTGYSDQAHLSREFVRWFGKTPSQLRQSPFLLDSLAQPGLGNWIVRS
ncbi:MAG: helix-turn-helix domain-containing protein [Lautropia sp.]|nr:helix-turn-helix domain-containing protein [Lautropia sp.]